MKWMENVINQQLIVVIQVVQWELIVVWMIICAIIQEFIQMYQHVLKINNNINYFKHYFLFN